MLRGIMCPNRLCQVSAPTCESSATSGADDGRGHARHSLLGQGFTFNGGLGQVKRAHTHMLSVLIRPKKGFLVELNCGVSCSKDGGYPRVHCCYRGEQVLSHSGYEVREDAHRNRLA